MKNILNGFSPWHTKEDSFDYDHPKDHNLLPSDVSINNKQSLSKTLQLQKKSSKLKTNQKQSHQDSKIIRSYSKTQSLAFKKQSDQNLNLTQRKFTNRAQSSNKSQRNERQTFQTINDQSAKVFHDQKWKMLTFASNDKFRNENSQIKKYHKFVEQLKSRRNRVQKQKPFSTINVQTMREKELQYENPSTLKTNNQNIVLQQVSVKNFIIHGHYSEIEFLPFQQSLKRRDVNFALKQKFDSVKRNPATKQNEPQVSAKKTRKSVLIRGKSNKNCQNLFNVIKLQRDMNSKVQQNKMR